MESEKVLKFLKLDKIIENVSAYIETRLQLFKIEAREELAEVLFKLIQAGLLFFIGFIAFLFLAVAGAIGIGHLIGNTAYGFLIVGGFFSLAFFLLLLFGDKMGINKKIYDYLGKPLNKKKDE